jgi:hypothetical protein
MTSRIVRNVFVSKSLYHAQLLQSRLPREWIGLPPQTTFRDVEEWDDTLYLMHICATTSIHYYLHSADIIRLTACSKLLIGDVLVEFDSEKQVIGHEIVNRIEFY